MNGAQLMERRLSDKDEKKCQAEFVVDGKEVTIMLEDHMEATVVAAPEE